MAKVFRHTAKLTTARMGDFERPIMPYVIRAAQAVTRAVIQPQPEAEETPHDFQAEIEHVMKAFGIRIAAARRLPVSERAAAIRALKWERNAALRAIRERRINDRPRKQPKKLPPINPD